MCDCKTLPATAICHVTFSPNSSAELGCVYCDKLLSLKRKYKGLFNLRRYLSK